MTPLPDVPGVLKFIYHLGLSGDANAIVRHFVKYNGTPPSPAACVSIADEAFTAYVDDIIPQTQTMTSINAVEITDLTSPTSGQGTSTSAATDGALTGAPLPAGAAFLVNFQIGRRYRGGKPRSYFPVGDSTSVLNPQLWTSDFTAAMQTGIGDLQGFYAGFSVLGTTGAGQCNVSYFTEPNIIMTYPSGRVRNQSTRRTVPQVDEIIGTVADQKMASQRRRNLQRS